MVKKTPVHKFLSTFFPLTNNLELLHSNPLAIAFSYLLRQFPTFCYESAITYQNSRFSSSPIVSSYQLPYCLPTFDEIPSYIVPPTESPVMPEVVLSDNLDAE